jgi:hypothetical protein
VKISIGRTSGAAVMPVNYNPALEPSVRTGQDRDQALYVLSDIRDHVGLDRFGRTARQWMPSHIGNFVSDDRLQSDGVRYASCNVQTQTVSASIGINEILCDVWPDIHSRFFIRLP